MNIYDFDETIFDGNSSVEMFLFSLKKHPGLVLKATGKSLGSLLKFIFRISDTKEVKEKLFSYLNRIEDYDAFILEFVELNKHKIKPYYMVKQQKNDVVISASFDTWVTPLCKAIGINNVIATIYDVKKAKVIGKNNHDLEKVKRFNKEYPNAVVNEAYSDSLHDIPMLGLAKRSFLVKGHNVIKYHSDFGEKV